MKQIIIIFGILLNSLFTFGQIEDSTSPTFDWITIVPDTVKNGDTITVTIKGTDDISGVNNVAAYLGSPINSFYYNLKSSFTSKGNGIFESKIRISDWAVGGNWSISNIFMMDSAWNSISLDTTVHFVVNSSTPDEDGPEIVSVVINPDTVFNGDTAAVQITVIDDLSGLKSISAAIGNSNDIFSHHLDNFQKIGENLYESKFKISKWAIGGNWEVHSISATDFEKNKTNSFDKIEFTVTSDNSDISAPTFDKVSVFPDTVYNKDTVTIQLTIRDDVSGVNWASCYLGTPENKYYISVGDFQKIGEDLFESKLAMDNWATSGQWYFHFLNAVDSADNKVLLDSSFYFTVINSVNLAVGENDNDQFSVYPNPVIDELNLDIYSIQVDDQLEIKVFDVRGQIHFVSNQFVNRIDLSQLRQGVYFLHLKGRKANFVQKILKK